MYMFFCSGGGGSGGRGGDTHVPAIVARFDAEGDLKSAARIKAVHSVREGTVIDAKLTVSGGATSRTAVVRRYASCR